MNPMLQEVTDIPARAADFLAQSPDYRLPLGVPYLGMGSSYFAPLAFKYMGVDIAPEMASEYVNYLAGAEPREQAVILSQSGRSSEALWARALFRSYVAVSNAVDSPLSQAANVSAHVDLRAGPEQFSSSKTYVNTLLALFKGFGLDAAPAVALLAANVARYRAAGEQMGDAIHGLLQRERIHGIYVLGSGPNLATAYQAALILSESTKLSVTGLAMAQYDHGPKETAAGSIVIQILAAGPNRERAERLSRTLAAAGAHVFSVEEPAASEAFSVLHNIVPFNYLAYDLSQRLGVTETFVVGGKVTEVSAAG